MYVSEDDASAAVIACCPMNRVSGSATLPYNHDGAFQDVCKSEKYIQIKFIPFIVSKFYRGDIFHEIECILIWLKAAADNFSAI